MTPTLFGRWQTRIFLLATVGVLVTLPFFFGYLGGVQGDGVYFFVLLYIAIFGMALDILYNYLQKFLWDHDWPGVFQLLAGITEAIFLIIVINVFGLPQILTTQFDLGIFIKHYSLVWIATYLSSWAVMRILFPRWRFRGGVWIGKWPSTRS